MLWLAFGKEVCVRLQSRVTRVRHRDVAFVAVASPRAAWFSLDARAVSCSSLWQDADAELAKVIIQGDCRPDAEFIDHNLARTVREAPAGIGSLLEQNPCAVDLRF